MEGYRNSEARWDETVRSNKINKSGRLKMRQDLDKVKSRFWRARPDQATPRGLLAQIVASMVRALMRRHTMVLKCIVYYDFLRQRRQFPG